jgi:hypothetical protein
MFFADVVSDFLKQNKMLTMPGSNRNNHPSAISELVEQRLRRVIQSGCYNDCIERRAIQPTIISIGRSDKNVGKT